MSKARSKTVTLRVTAAEKKHIEKQAKRYQLPVSEYLRMQALAPQPTGSMVRYDATEVSAGSAGNVTANSSYYATTPQVTQVQETVTTLASKVEQLEQQINDKHFRKGR